VGKKSKGKIDRLPKKTGKNRTSEKKTTRWGGGGGRRSTDLFSNGWGQIHSKTRSKAHEKEVEGSAENRGRQEGTSMWRPTSPVFTKRARANMTQNPEAFTKFSRRGKKEKESVVELA